MPRRAAPPDVVPAALAAGLDLTRSPRASAFESLRTITRPRRSFEGLDDPGTGARRSIALSQWTPDPGARARGRQPKRPALLLSEADPGPLDHGGAPDEAAAEGDEQRGCRRALKRPSSQASQRARGMEAEDVLPYFSQVDDDAFSAGRPRPFATAEMMRGSPGAARRRSMSSHRAGRPPQSPGAMTSSIARTAMRKTSRPSMTMQ